MGFFGGEDRRKAPLLERQHVNSIRFGIDACRVAHDIDKAIKRMQAAEEVIVVALGERQKCGEITAADTLQNLKSTDCSNRIGVLRTDAVVQNFVELAHFSRTGHLEGE